MDLTTRDTGRLSTRLGVFLATLALLVTFFPTSIVLAAPPRITLDQCRNGTAASPNPCTAVGGGTGWVNGNVGGSQGHLLEGYSIPYRAVLENIPTGTPITLEMGYDIKHSGANAIDYLTHFQRLLPHGIFSHAAETVSPTSGVTGYGASTDTHAIPVPSSAGSPAAGQPTTSFNALVSNEGAAAAVMTIFGGDITSVTYGTQGNLAASQSETAIVVTFTSQNPTAVLAWGGHIARGDDWNGASASSISGSPYHMRLKSWTVGNVGNQDRSLSADAVISPPKLIVIKNVINDNGGDNVAADFTMRVSGGGSPASFAGAASPGTTVLFPDTATYAVTEDPVTGYTQTGATADCAATIRPEETRTCTITNDDVAPTLALDKTVVNDAGGNAVENDFVLSATPTTGTTITDAGGDVPATAARSNTVYTLSETTLTGYSEGTWSCTGTGVKAFSAANRTVELHEGAAVTCSITNDDVAPTLALDKTVSGGNATEDDFVLSATPTTGTTITDPGGDVPATAAQSNMTYTLGETTATGYSEGTWSCTGTGLKAFSATNKTVELNEGATVTCSITNTEVAPTLALDRTVVNSHGGDAVEDDFVLSATPTSGDAITDDGGDVAAVTAQSNTVYTLSETALTGYAEGTWGCTGTGLKAFDATAKTVELNEGATVTCSITNTDSPAQPTGATVQSWTLHDSIVISGIRHGADDEDDATVTFRLYADSSCESQVGEDEVRPVGGSGNNTAATVTGVTVTETGFYYWQVEYSGDTNNLGFTTACGQEVTQIQARDDKEVGGGIKRNNLLTIL